MKISLDESYHASTDNKTLGFVGETNSRTITIEGYQCEGADSYKMRFKYPDGVVYDVDVSGGTYTIDGSILRRVGDVYLQILACRSDGDTYEFVKKSNILTLHICSALNGEPAPVPTYEKSLEALEKVVAAEKSSAENVSKAEIASNAAQAAQNAAEQAKETAQTAADIATDKAAEISKSAEQIQKNTDDIAKLYSKSDGIVCSAEGTEITLNDSSELPFSGMKIFGRSTQDGTPSPDYPQEIVSVGNSGRIETILCASNLIDYYNAVPNATGSIRYDGDRLYYQRNVTNAGNVAVQGGATWVVYLLKGMIHINASNSVYLRIYKGDVFKNGYSGNNRIYTSATCETTFEISESGFYTFGLWTDAINAEQYVDSFNVNYVNTVGIGTYITPQSFTFAVPNGLPGIPVDSGGNYTDESGQQWLCDEIDLGRGVYVQRLLSEILTSFSKVSYETENMYSYQSTLSKKVLGGSKYPALSDKLIYTYNRGDTQHFYADNNTNIINVFLPKNMDVTTFEMNILAILYEPIENPLTAEEISAYKSLHTNKPTTVITNSDNAHMSVDYTADTKTYIDNKFNELATAIVATGGDT